MHREAGFHEDSRYEKEYKAKTDLQNYYPLVFMHYSFMQNLLNFLFIYYYHSTESFRLLSFTVIFGKRITKGIPNIYTYTSTILLGSKLSQIKVVALSYYCYYCQ
jgi:hypothetical protein